MTIEEFRKKWKHYAFKCHAKNIAPYICTKNGENEMTADLRALIDEAVREREICKCIRWVRWRVNENFCSLCGGRKPPEGGNDG